MAKDNNQLLAEKIYEIEHADWEQEKEWRKQNVTNHWLTKDIYMHRSEDCMMWYLWKYVDYKGEFCHFKCIPAFGYEKDAIEEMLKIQRWIWI